MSAPAPTITIDPTWIRNFLTVPRDTLPTLIRGRLDDYSMVSAYRTDTGWWMYASKDAADHEEHATAHDLADYWPAGLLPIVEQAHDAECPYILFTDTTAPPAKRTFLDISTGHLQRRTCERLNTLPGVTAYNIPFYGWLMATPAENHSDWPTELEPIVGLAHTSGCAYVVFDCDAEIIEGLPTYDW